MWEWNRCGWAGRRESGCLWACDEGDLMTLQGGDAKAVLTRRVSDWGRRADSDSER